MIYVLFGPPGVGKTYVGQLLGRSLNLPFFDADILIDAEERRLLQSGEYNQEARDVFVKKLISYVQNMQDTSGSEQDLLIAEAFTKEKNRNEFVGTLMGNVTYIMIDAPVTVARERSISRLKGAYSNHAINASALEMIWDEFEKPKTKYISINNHGTSDEDIVEQFVNLIQSEHTRK